MADFKNEKTILFLMKIGGILSLIGFLLALLIELEFFSEELPVRILLSSTDIIGDNLNDDIQYTLGLIGAGIALFAATREDDSIPINWIIIMFLAIWILVFGCLIGGILIILASIIILLERFKIVSDRVFKK